MVDHALGELWQQVGDEVVLAGQVHHGAGLTIGVDHIECGNSCSFCHALVVGTEGGCYMYDTCTIFRCHVVAGNNVEGVGGTVG